MTNIGLKTFNVVPLLLSPHTANDVGGAKYHQPQHFPHRVNRPERCSLQTHNLLVLNEHDFAASKARDHDVVDDETENNSANSQTLVVENQHINPPEEPELMANADYDALKKPHTNQRNVRTKGKVYRRKNRKLKKQRREAREAKKEVKKLKLSSCRPKPIKSRPNSLVESTSKDGVIRCPACEEEYCDKDNRRMDPVL
ncbi:hypothetical protein TNCV_3232671 [Trichonephila clavipes]|nr:hypothetical protein TNCV_3232671 [Trichonephila clavipes]